MSGGDTAWVLTSTALVLFMTIPGLALFYGGLVRTKNVLSVLMQCFAITCVVSLLWLVARLQPGVRRRQRLHRRLRQGDVRGVAEGTLKGTHSRVGVFAVSDDVRDHHAGARRRRIR